MCSGKNVWSVWWASALLCCQLSVPFQLKVLFKTITTCVALLQGSPSPIEYRWAVLNTAGTWPEILRRYVMSRSIATMLHPLVSPKVSSTAAMLSSKCAQLLTADQHLILLR